jgi:hypothetical protein
VGLPGQGGNHWRKYGTFNCCTVPPIHDLASVLQPSVWPLLDQQHRLILEAMATESLLGRLRYQGVTETVGILRGPSILSRFRLWCQALERKDEAETD